MNEMDKIVRAALDKALLMRELRVLRAARKIVKNYNWVSPLLNIELAIDLLEIRILALESRHE